jgi:hypothetical protein
VEAPQALQSPLLSDHSVRCGIVLGYRGKSSRT